MVHLGDTASFLRVVRIYAKKGREMVTRKNWEETKEIGPFLARGKTRRRLRQ